MDEAAAEPVEHLFQPRDLFEHRTFDLLGRQIHFEAPEILAIRIAGMRAQPHAARQRQPRSSLHGTFISGVRTASDIGGRDVLHQGRFVRGIVELAQVAVQVHGYIKEYSHSSCVRNRTMAWSRVTSSKRTGSRGRNWPTRHRSAEITLAGLG